MKNKKAKIHFYNPPGKNKKTMEELIADLLDVLSDPEEMAPVFNCITKL